MMRRSIRFRSRRRRRPLRAAALCAAACLVVAAGVFAAAQVPAVHALLGAFPAARGASARAAAEAPQKTRSSSASAAAASSRPAASSQTAVRAAQVSLQQAAKPLWIKVSIADQVTTVYDAADRVVASWLCSTGSPGHDTPAGTFTVYNRGKRFFSKKYQEGGYYWVAFYEDYYFHSVPFDVDGKIIQSVAEDLGHKDSHGCVHLTVDESQWVYENIPNGTKVVIG